MHFWTWTAIAFSFASVRVFELGISLDPALYSIVARNILKTRDLWNLTASPNLYPQFYEHPFLAIWLQAAVFKIFGATDAAARLVGLLLGSLSFGFLFKIGEQLCSMRFGYLVCLLTLFTIPFSGRMPTFYLEVPMTFFFLMGSYFCLKLLTTRSSWDGALTGLGVGLAFLTKGLASLPILATLGSMGLIRHRLALFKISAAWIGLGVLVVAVGLFCGFQNIWGNYSFWRLYLEDCFVKRTLEPGLSVGPMPFLTQFLRLHPLHVFLVLGTPWAFFKKLEVREAILFGGVASFFLLLANALLGFPFHHYYYPIYPFFNLLTAAALYPLVERFSEQRYVQLCAGLIVIYTLFWNLYPGSMRSKNPIDYYQLAPVFSALKEKGIRDFDAVGFSQIDWPYREFSLWYWDLPSNVVTTPTASVVLSRGGIEPKGYLLCRSGLEFVIWVKEKSWIPLCQKASFPKRWLK